MAANLSPEFREAESAYKKARDAKERLECLKEMLRTIPKHKGTEHLQADIKTRIKNTTDDLASPKKSGAARGGPAQVIRPEGAAQIGIIGAPNVGKSALHDALTGSKAKVGPHPFTTQYPQPGMLPHEDIYFQLVDLPPVSADYLQPWIGSSLTPADACMLVVDLTDPDCVEHVIAIREQLVTKHVTLFESWSVSEQDEGSTQLFAVRLPTLLVINKADLLDDPTSELAVFSELLGASFPSLVVSASTGLGLDQMGPSLYDGLSVIRVYTKVPGRDADRAKPFTLRHGQTVHDVATQVHRDVAKTLKYARIWGTATFDGQQVSRDHALADGDIVELHASAVQLRG